MRKKYLATVLACGMLLSLTGCGADNETIAQLNGIEALGSESNQGNEYNISFSDKQEMIYAQVADRTLLDLSKLDACSENELQQTHHLSFDANEYDAMTNADTIHAILFDKLYNRTN